MNVKPDVKRWLLEDNNPSAKYLAMTSLFGADKLSKEVIEQEKTIYGFTPCAKILRKIDEGIFWDDTVSPYAPKYKTVYWQIIILSQLGVSTRNEKIKGACEFVLKLQHPEGGFSEQIWHVAERAYLDRKRRWDQRGEKVPDMNKWVSDLVHESELTCLTGNLLISFINMGFGISDPRIMKAYEWLIKTQNKDGGWLCPYWRAHIKDKHSCFIGAITPLEALSLIPEEQRNAEMKRSIEKGAEFLLMHHLYKADHHSFEVINDNWLKLSFPVFWYDFLRGLNVMAKLGYLKDKRARDAVELLLRKQTAEGKWNLEKTPKGRMYADFGKVGEPNKWVTINALRVIKEL